MTEVHVLICDHCEQQSIAGVYRDKKDAEAEMNNPALIRSCEFAYVETFTLQ